MDTKFSELRFKVSAQYDPEAGVWCGQCPELGIFTEGAGLDELFSHCREMVPVMLPDYGYSAPAENVRLVFEV
jgi:hypothetical protein